MTDREVVCHRRNLDYRGGKGDMGEGSWKTLCIQDVEREENKSSGHMEICCVAGNSLYDFHGQELCLLHC